MKRVQFTLLAVLLVTIAAMAQSKSDASKQSAQATNDKTPATTAAPQNPANPAKALPQAKTQEEFKAYQDAMAIIQKGDPAQSEVAADAFAAKFKNSEITTSLYHRVLLQYQNQNNADKAIESGNKILAIAPNDPIANVLVASLLSERVRDTDIDRDERLAEAEKDAKKALQTVDTDFVVNPGTPQEQIDASKNMIRSMAYSALANTEATRMNYSASENYFKQAVAMPGAPMDAVTLLRYSLLLDKEKKYSEALVQANKAFEAAPAGSPVQDLVKNERQRLMMLLSGSAPAPKPAPTAQAPATTNP
jgi:tetratricopeptide (TPR) repeat protein